MSHAPANRPVRGVWVSRPTFSAAIGSIICFNVRRSFARPSLKEKLIKISAKVVSHGRYVVFQMAEVAIPRQMFQEILRLIAELRPQPPPAPA